MIISYKDVNLLRRFITERGKIMPARVSGVSVKAQRKLAVEIKRAPGSPCCPTRSSRTEGIMQVILQRDVPNLGLVGEVVSVKARLRS